MPKIILLITIVVSMMFLTSCMAGLGENTPSTPAGFFKGIWHGWIAPFALIGQLFNSEIRIYEVHNVGFLYELGFYMAIISGFGGLSIFRTKKKKERY